MRLTGKDRYRQAMLKTRLTAARDARAFFRGEVAWLHEWRTKEFIEAELERAYEAGLRDARGADAA